MKFALRQLAKSPAFTLIAVLSLALGIGANTALFSLVDDILLKSLPVQRPDDLVLFRWLSARNGLHRGTYGYIPLDPATGLRTSTSLSYFIFDRLRADPGTREVFSDFFAFAGAGAGRINLNIDQQAELGAGALVSGGYFAGLGVRASHGRTLDDSDNQPGAPPVAMISDAFWERRFARDPAVIGKTIRANNVGITIVGITPPGFKGSLQLGEVPDVTFPLALEPQLRPDESLLHQPLRWWMHLMGRLKPGVTAAQAQARLEAPFVQAARDAWIARQGAERLEAVDTRAAPLLRLVPGGQGLMDARRGYAQPLRILVVIVAAVLLIACANVANLLLARSATRTREIAVRLSLGATRGRIIRQLLAESLLLSLLGGAAGVLVAYWGRAALLTLRPIAGSEALSLDWRVLGFTLGASVLTGILFGLAPAWRATRVDLNTAMKAGAAGATGRSRFALRSGLMIGQIALSVVLLVGAGLFLRTLANLRQVDAGFARENLLLFTLDAGLNGYTRPQFAALFERVRERVAALPGVRSAGFSRIAFLTGGRRSLGISAAGRPLPPAAGDVYVNIVDPSFFETMGIPLMLGRNFSARDTADAPLVAVVSQKFAAQLFPGENPLGQRFAFGPNPDVRPIEIVGVVRDVHYADLRGELPLTVYTPFQQEISGQATFAVRTAGDPHALAGAIRQAVQAVDANVPLYNLRTQEEQVTQLVSSERVFALLTAFFGAVALVLTCIGLYGLLAHSVVARTREIGIRMALGAQLRAVMSLVLTDGLRLAVLGVVLGIGLALGLTRFVANLLFGVPSTDPATLAGAGLLLVGIAALACFIPARRAARVEPMDALRAE